MDLTKIDKATAAAIQHRSDLFSLLDELDGLEVSQIKDRVFELCQFAKTHADAMREIQKESDESKEYN